MRTKDLSRGLWAAIWLAFIAGPAAAGCIIPPLSPELVNQFKSNPGNLIPSPDTDARTVEATARDLAGTEPALATDLIQVAKKAPPRFKAAIAAGLAQAALACMTVNQQAALQIQQAVASFPDGQFQALFAAVVGDMSTAATAAAESAAVGSSGSVVVVNPNVSTTAKTSPGGGGSAGRTSGVFAVANPDSSNGVTTGTVGVTAANPVSATR
ncbi:MAG TPA: hypothetical protein VG168_07825 [Bryobacteraceae bacterium]|jgi:hypothetical protein|nr:hypothetical protein [Bryobacteraceae bacterium]